ncbi:pH-dependent sodium/proton antiporter [Actinobacillus equuli]|nr:pH-dependent sodium/proton antiporter [Actinobacillus equuli]
MKLPLILTNYNEFHFCIRLKNVNVGKEVKRNIITSFNDRRFYDQTDSEISETRSSKWDFIVGFSLTRNDFANTDLQQLYFSFLQTEVAIKFGAFSIDKPLLMWVNDGFMAVFFI